MRAPLLVLLLVWSVSPSLAAVELDSAVFYDTGATQRSLAIGDLDGDGRGDLVVVHRNGTLSTLRNLGGGTFGGAVSHGALWPVDTTADVVAGDVDRDGDLDLLVAHTTTYGSVSLLRNRGDGTFDPPQEYETCYSTQMLVLADLDGDLRLDIAGHSNCFQASIFLNNGDGTFRDNGEYGRGYTPGGIDAGDLDRDGDLDIAFGNGTSDVSVLPNDGTGGFGPHSSHDVHHNPRQLRIADIDGDGDLDIVTANQYGNFLSVLRNDGSGGFPSLPENHFPGSGTWGLALPDLDDDGDADAVVANRDNDHLSVLHNDGDGVFVDRLDQPAADEPFAVASGDLDGDALPDVAAVHRNATEVAVYRNVTAVPADTDGDRVTDAEDCAPSDPGSWRLPGAVMDLLLDGTRLSWSAPGRAGAGVPAYDVLRTDNPSNFAQAVCVGASGIGRTRVDEEIPTALFAYLVRARNACGGNAGRGSDGAPRVLPSCP